jgi:hypothetical protein
MKYLFLILFISVSRAASLPDDIYINNQSGFDIKTKSIEKISESLEKLNTTQDEVIDQINFKENKSLSDWKMTGFATTLGISSSGKLGIIGFKGSASTEVYWKRKPTEQSFVAVTEDETPDLNADIEVADTSRSGINDQVESAFAIVKASGKVKNLDEAKKGLRKNIEEFANLVGTLKVDTTKKYYFAGIRYDLSVGASGTVATSYNIGGTVLIRMVWRPIKKINQSLGKNLITEESPLQKMINDTAISLENLSENSALEKNGLKLQSIRFGYGKSIAGKIGLISAKSSLMFSVIFAKNHKYKPSENNLVKEEYATSEIRFDDNIAINWAKFGKGLNKAVRISRPFLRRSERSSKKWEISTMKLAFTVSGTRGIGLTTVGDIGQVQLIYTK